jgi:hypothetical protein
MENNFLGRKSLSGDARGAVRIYSDVVFAQNNLDDLKAGKAGLVTVGGCYNIKSEKDDNSFWSEKYDNLY